MDTNLINVFQQAQEDAEQTGSAFAKTVKDLSGDDDTELCSFVDILFDFYYISDNRQFIDFLILLGDVYGIPLSPEVKTYRTDEERANVYIFIFLETIFYAVLAAVGVTPLQSLFLIR